MISSGMIRVIDTGSMMIVRTTSVAALPASSVTLYLRVYSPTTVVFTEPVTTILSVRSPSTASVALAPGSVKLSPTSRLMEASPLSVITGAISSTSVIAKLTVVAALVLPAASLAVTVKL